MNRRFSSILGARDIGIDLGTANTLVYVRGEGIIINEPSVVAINQKTGQIVAIGQEARRMVGRTPAHIVAVKPLVEGVISDFEVTEAMLQYFIQKVHEGSFIFHPRPRVVVGIPSGITEVERKAVEDAVVNAGAREVYLVEEPMCAAIGVRLPIQDAVGNMIVDIGGGTTDIAVISLGGIVISNNLRVAGNKLNDDIVQYARDEFKLLLGERTAEDIKIAIGTAKDVGQRMQAVMRGRDLVTGLPREVTVDDRDIRAAIGKSVATLIEAVKHIVEETPPELVADLMHRGITLVGGGSLLKGLDQLMSDELEIPVQLAEDPLTAVVRGTGVILEDIDAVSDVFVSPSQKKAPKV